MNQTLVIQAQKQCSWNFELNIFYIKKCLLPDCIILVIKTKLNSWKNVEKAIHLISSVFGVDSSVLWSSEFILDSTVQEYGRNSQPNK